MCIVHSCQSYSVKYIEEFSSFGSYQCLVLTNKKIMILTKAYVYQRSNNTKGQLKVSHKVNCCLSTKLCGNDKSKLQIIEVIVKLGSDMLK